jgi:hypothetical protein
MVNRLVVGLMVLFLSSGAYAGPLAYTYLDAGIGSTVAGGSSSPVYVVGGSLAVTPYLNVVAAYNISHLSAYDAASAGLGVGIHTPISEEMHAYFQYIGWSTSYSSDSGFSYDSTRQSDVVFGARWRMLDSLELDAGLSFFEGSGGSNDISGMSYFASPLWNFSDAFSLGMTVQLSRGDISQEAYVAFVRYCYTPSAHKPVRSR